VKFKREAHGSNIIGVMNTKGTDANSKEYQRRVEFVASEELLNSLIGRSFMVCNVTTTDKPHGAFVRVEVKVIELIEDDE